MLQKYVLAKVVLITNRSMKGFYKICYLVTMGNN